jgi:hypothetical protein
MWPCSTSATRVSQPAALITRTLLLMDKPNLCSETRRLERTGRKSCCGQRLHQEAGGDATDELLVLWCCSEKAGQSDLLPVEA